MIIPLILASIIWTTTHSASCSDITRCSDLNLEELAYDATGGRDILDATNGNVRRGARHPGCCKNPCTALYNYPGSDELSSFTIHQSTVGFKNITIIYDMNPNALDASDACNAKYSSNGGSSYDTIEAYVGDNTDRKGEVKVLPDDASNNSGFQLKFDQTLTSYEDWDFCNIEFLSICGTFAQPSLEPTAPPSLRPTASSTNPSASPTKNPSATYTVDGIWQEILHQDLREPATGLFSSSFTTLGDDWGIENEQEPSANAFSIVGLVTHSVGLMTPLYFKYRFKMIYGFENANGSMSTSTLRWSQSSPLSAENIEGFTDFSSNPPQSDGLSTCHTFNGLGRSSTTTSTLLDGTGGGDCWWNAAGAISLQGSSSTYDGIPAFNQQFADTVTLYICTGSVDCDDTKHVKCGIDPSTNTYIDCTLQQGINPPVAINAPVLEPKFHHKPENIDTPRTVLPHVYTIFGDRDTNGTLVIAALAVMVLSGCIVYVLLKWSAKSKYVKVINFDTDEEEEEEDEELL